MAFDRIQKKPASACATVAELFTGGEQICRNVDGIWNSRCRCMQTYHKTDSTVFCATSPPPAELQLELDTVRSRECVRSLRYARLACSKSLTSGSCKMSSALGRESGSWDSSGRTKFSCACGTPCNRFVVCRVLMILRFCLSLFSLLLVVLWALLPETNQRMYATYRHYFKERWDG